MIVKDIATTDLVLAFPTSTAPPSTLYPKNAETVAIIKANTNVLINE